MRQLRVPTIELRWVDDVLRWVDDVPEPLVCVVMEIPTKAGPNQHVGTGATIAEAMRALADHIDRKAAGAYDAHLRELLR